MGKSRNRLVPQHVSHVAWLSDQIDEEAARSFLASQRGAGQLDAVASSNPRHAALAADLGATFLTGETAFADLVSRVKVKDWVLMVRDRPAPQSFLDLMEHCVFNPGVAYFREESGESICLFNLRASSLNGGGDLFDIAAKYPDRKRVVLKSDRVEDYKLSDVGMFIRRAYKRVTWLKRKLDGKPVPRGPLGEFKGNRIAG